MQHDSGTVVWVRGHPEPGEVVGITMVENATQAAALGYPIGSVLYTVEFGDGSEMFLSELLRDSPPC